MSFFLFFIIELVCLFLLSRLLTELLSHLLLKLTHSVSVTIHILSFLFLPGVVVHELSHMFMASLLFVRTGAIEFWPQVQGTTVKLGSVQVAKTDILRRFIIGAAPLIGGIGLLLVLFISLSPSYETWYSWRTIIFIYSLFEISNTMFSSKKDMEGAIMLFVILLLFISIFLLLGFRFDIQTFANLFSPPVATFFQKLDGIFIIPVIVNIVVCIGMRLFLQKR